MNESYVVDSDGDDRTDCDLYIVGQVETTDPVTEEPRPTTVRLGDPFFTSFLPVFDVANDQLGFALSWRAPEKSSMTARSNVIDQSFMQ